jgi:2-polyprenyl-3-methyl-5-hydroxy-6-metoxy-1,4-benzoquinol methylase
MSINKLQPIDELEKWWEEPDPWNYDTTPDDLKRRGILLSVLPQKKFKKVLDIGCGNGFVTVRLPGKEITAIDISANAIRHAKNRSRKFRHIHYLQHSIFDLALLNWGKVFDLINITGVLYPQYIGSSELLVYTIIDNLLAHNGILVTCHIEEWYSARFPYITLDRQYYSYREYVHLLEVYSKI